MNEQSHRIRLENIAIRAMTDRGLLAEFSEEELSELEKLKTIDPLNGFQEGDAADVRDLRELLWASIDNDDSRDIDQLSTAELQPNGQVKILVAIADVDSLVKKGSAIDKHARHNTTSVYTAAKVFPMLPEALSTGMTSLNVDKDRLSIVVEMVMNTDGSTQSSDIYRAVVRNHAQLAYHSVAAWLGGGSDAPAPITDVKGLAENLRLQDKVAQSMKTYRHAHGALSLVTIEAKPLFINGQLKSLEREEKDRAKEIIEDFMISANGVVARYLWSRKYPSIRRVVRTPKRWDRIVELAKEHGGILPDAPDSNALEEFLNQQKNDDPLRFPDLSLSVVKLLGPGEYSADQSGRGYPGHFGLAVKDYTHSTAPNRRYTDLITQRILKAALQNQESPYNHEELGYLARHCTQEEDAANKVERQVGKSAAALLLESRIGEHFHAIVTGAAAKGTWVRLLNLPVEGKLVRGYKGVDVGKRISVKLVAVDVERGYIDFIRSAR
ncbi:MAG: RNB domain-containing ribonuclease [Anaerolineales bacterium]|jgi:exoribonuclease-2